MSLLPSPRLLLLLTLVLPGVPACDLLRPPSGEDDPASAVAVTGADPAVLSAVGPTDVVISGAGFGAAGTDAIVRLLALSGTPFAGGTDAVLEVDGRVAADDRIETTVPASECVGAAASRIEVVLADGTAGASEAALLSFDHPPVVTEVVFEAVGHVQASIPAPGIFQGVADPEGRAPTLVEGATTSLGGGVLSIDPATGAFTYDGPLGFAGTDGFTVVVSDGLHEATVPIDVVVTGPVWFVDAAAPAGGDGRSHTPFDSLVALAGAADVPDDARVFVRSGVYTGPLELPGGRAVVGQGVALEVEGTLVEAAGPAPTVVGPDGSPAVVLQGAGTVRGLLVTAPTDDGLLVTADGRVVIEDVTVLDCGGAGLRVSGAPSSGAATLDLRRVHVSRTATGLLVDVEGDADTSLALNLSDVRIEDTLDDGAVISLGGHLQAALDLNLLDVRDVEGHGLVLEAGGDVEALATLDTVRLEGMTGLVAGLDPDRGLEVTASGRAALTVRLLASKVLAFGDELVQIQTLGSGTQATLHALVAGCTLAGSLSDQGVRLRVDDQSTLRAVLRDNVLVDNADPFSAGFFSNSGARLELKLEDNDDDAGYDLVRHASGDFVLAGDLAVGTTGPDDAGNLAALGNTTGGGAPAVSVSGTGAIRIVARSTVPDP